MDEGFRVVTWRVLGSHVLPLNNEKEQSDIQWISPSGPHFLPRAFKWGA